MLTLPELVEYSNYNNWPDYLEGLYEIFRKDFIDTKPKYLGLDVVCFIEPVFQGKEFTFWHLITEGNIEINRTPDFRRCERINWPKPIIENSKDGNIKVWENVRKNKKGKKTKRISICYGNWEYLVILGIRKKHYSFVTAYPVFRGHTKQKLKKEYTYE